MTINKFYYACSSFLLLLAAFVLLSPSLISPDFIYPVRLDSTLADYKLRHESARNDSILLTPEAVGLRYENISIRTAEGFKLRGWFVSSPDTPANTVLIIHDLNQSRISFIDHLKQFHDRGINACAVDMRGHGESGGEEFSPGIPAVSDIKHVIDYILGRKDSRKLAVMGIGTGAAIAMQVALYDGRCDALVLQSPFNNLDTYLNRYENEKWKGMKYVWAPVFRRKVERLLNYPIEMLDLTEIAANTHIPSLYITGSDDNVIYTSETLQVYNAAASEKKQLILVKNAGHFDIALIGGDKYYNRISSFITFALPKEQKSSRYKKLALNDN
jgi:uncharacterized protein